MTKDVIMYDKMLSARTYLEMMTGTYYCLDADNQVEAVEKILLSKVVAKLEFKNVDNKDKLVKQFNKLGLMECSKFVSKLNED